MILDCSAEFSSWPSLHPRGPAESWPSPARAQLILHEFCFLTSVPRRRKFRRSLREADCQLGENSRGPMEDASVRIRRERKCKPDMFGCLLTGGIWNRTTYRLFVVTFLFSSLWTAFVPRVESCGLTKRLQDSRPGTCTCQPVSCSALSLNPNMGSPCSLQYQELVWNSYHTRTEKPPQGAGEPGQAPAQRAVT